MCILNITIFVKIFCDDNFIFQEFIFKTKKSNYKYLLNNKFSLNRKLMDLIRNKYSLNFYSVDLTQEKDRIIVKYKKTENFKEENFDSQYFVINGLVPDNTGCNFCEYRKNKDGYIICSFQNNKVYKKSLKRCKLFSQKDV